MEPQQHQPLAITAIDVTKAGNVTSHAVAYYSPATDGDFYTFLKDVGSHETIQGFEWDGKDKFGVILG